MTPRFSLKVTWGLVKIQVSVVCSRQISEDKIYRIMILFIKIVSTLLKHTYILSSFQACLFFEICLGMMKNDLEQNDAEYNVVSLSHLQV